MRFTLIDEEKSHHSVSRMSRVLGATAAGYHAWKNRLKSARTLEDEKLKEHLVLHHEASRGTYGVPRLFDDLVDEGIHVSRKRIARLMCELGIAGVPGREGSDGAASRPCPRPMGSEISCAATSRQLCRTRSSSQT